MAAAKAVKPKVKSDKIKQYHKAYTLYLRGDLGTEKIAKQVKVSDKTIKDWVKKFNWKADREKTQADIRKQLQQKAAEDGVEYILDIGQLQKEMVEEDLPEAEVKSKEGVVRALIELDKLKLLRQGKLPNINVFTADDILIALREYNKDDKKKKPG